MQKTWERLEPVVRHYTTPCFSQRKLQHAFATERLSYMVHCSARLHANLYENNFYSHLNWYIETSNPLFTGNGHQLLWFSRGSQVYHEGGGMRWGDVGWCGVALKKVWALNGNRKSSMVRALLMLEQLQCVRGSQGYAKAVCRHFCFRLMAEDKLEQRVRAWQLGLSSWWQM